MNAKLFLATCLLATSTFAASQGTLFLEGTIATVNDIIVDNLPASKTLDILNGQGATEVAQVSEISNNLSGYTISYRSKNGSKLVNEGDTVNTPKASTTYTMSYYGSAFAAVPSVDTPIKTVSSLPGLTTNTSMVSVIVNGNATAPAGTYTDEVYISISANL